MILQSFIPRPMRKRLFVKWVERTSMPDDLKIMFNEFVSHSFNTISAYWIKLAKDSLDPVRAKKHYFRHFRPRHLSLYENIFGSYEELFVSLLKTHVSSLGESGESHDRLTGLVDYLPIKDLNPRSIIEIGAGDGRVSKILIEKFKPERYAIVDIPPALYHVQGQFPASFYLPHQIPDEQFDLMVAIDCLHEMDKKQVQKYFEYAKTHAKYLYIKAWQNPGYPWYSQDTYPFPGTQVFNRASFFPKGYFEALYKL